VLLVLVQDMRETTESLKPAQDKFAQVRRYEKRMLAVANVEPERAKAAFAGNAEAQQALFASHAAARRDFPHGLKGLMAERFGTSRAARLG
jgi:hypothetical protein